MAHGLVTGTHVLEIKDGRNVSIRERRIGTRQPEGPEMVLQRGDLPDVIQFLSSVWRR